MKVKLYHTSPSHNRDSILKHGLIPKARGIAEHEDGYSAITYKPRIFLSNIPKDLNTLDFIGQYENVDFWEVEVDGDLIYDDPWTHKKGFHFYTEQPIKEVKLFHNIPPYQHTKEQLLEYENFLNE